MDNLKRLFEAAVKRAFDDDKGEVPERYRIGLPALRYSFAVALARAGAPLVHIS